MTVCAHERRSIEMSTDQTGVKSRHTCVPKNNIVRVSSAPVHPSAIVQFVVGAPPQLKWCEYSNPVFRTKLRGVFRRDDITLGLNAPISGIRPKPNALIRPGVRPVHRNKPNELRANAPNCALLPPNILVAYGF
jgi:hypothetical protein